MSPRISSPMTIEFALLGLLDRKSMHGYELHREFTSLQGVGLVWSVKLSLLYALLEKLEAAGLVVSTYLPGESSPPRKQYSLTPAGRESYMNWRQSPVEHPRDMRQDFLARLYFAGLAGSAAARRLLQRQRAACLSWLEEDDRQAQQFGSTHPFEQLVFDFRIRQVQAMVGWLDGVEGRLEP